MMNDIPPRIIGIGNALVDLTYHVPDLASLPVSLQKDSACLISTEQWHELNRALSNPSNISPGGSSSNTIAGIANLGGAAGLIGVIADDDNGRLLERNLQELSIHSYLAKSASQDKATGNCIVLISEDGTRTMAAYIGVAGELSPQHITKEPICHADVLFLEGYLFDTPKAQEAFYHACAIANEHQTKTIFSLSDISCVQKHKDAICSFLDTIDILFGNRAEILALTDSDNLDDAARRLYTHNIEQACITDGANGAYTVNEKAIVHSPAHYTAQVIDLNGAGDGFAAGFLYAYLYGQSESTDFHACARLGHAYAQKVVETSGPRPSVDAMKDILSQYAS